MEKKLVLPRLLREEMLAHVRACLPEEACGILGGRSGEGQGGCRVAEVRLDLVQMDLVQMDLVQMVIALKNELRSPVRFRINPQEQLHAFQRLEKLEMDLVGIWHSHPLGPGGLSPTDLAEAYYPEAALLVWSPVGTPVGSPGESAGQEWQLRVFYACEGQVDEAAIVDV